MVNRTGDYDRDAPPDPDAGDPVDGDRYDVVLVERSNRDAVEAYLKRIRDATDGDRAGSDGGA